MPASGCGDDGARHRAARRWMCRRISRRRSRGMRRRREAFEALSFTHRREYVGVDRGGEAAGDPRPPCRGHGRARTSGPGAALMSKLRGALAAAVTPLREGGAALDEDAFGPYADFLVAGGLDGILALGTTGEGLLFAAEERRRVRRALRGGGRGPPAGGGALRRADDARHGRAGGARRRGGRGRGRRDRAAVLPARRARAPGALRSPPRPRARRCPSTSTSSSGRAATPCRCRCSSSCGSARRTSPG